MLILTWRPGLPSPIQTLTYPCTCNYKTTNFLLGVSRGRSMIPFYCLLASSSSRCGTRRFASSRAIVDRDLNVLTHPQSGILIRTIEAHTETVSALAWVPDGSGFISGSQDRRINLWVRHCRLSTCHLINCRLCATVQGSDGKQRDSWGITAIRITDLAVTPDFTRLVAIGDSAKDPTLPSARGDSVATSAASRNGNNNPSPSVPRTQEHLMIVYDLTTKQPEL
jgi:WD40 repeat protein